MKELTSALHRICIAQNENVLVNMVYTEIGGNDHEVFGAFSGQGAGGGLFFQDSDGNITVSDDPDDFSTSVDEDTTKAIFLELEKLRAEMERLDERGNLIGFSQCGLAFLSESEANNGYIEAYSADASEDFIYDLQEEWNLNFFKD